MLLSLSFISTFPRCPIRFRFNNDVEVRDGVEFVYQYGIKSFPFRKTRLDELVKEEREREKNQTIIGLLANFDRDYLLGRHSSLHQVRMYI